MNATVILGMLCVHLMCFCVMFLLISIRLKDRKMGTDVFAAGHLLLGLAYFLQLLGGAPGWGVMSVVNHTLTFCAPVMYVLGAIRFFDRPIPVWGPLLAVAGCYTVAQVLVQATLGTEARHALLAGSCAALFLGMTVALLYGMRTFARDLRVEMVLFAVLIGGNSKSHTLTPAIMEKLAGQLRTLNAGLMVTASRRTGKENEEILKRALNGSNALIWDGTGENPYFGMLAWADYILVTADSASMLSDAGTTGKPVYMVALDGGSPRLDRLHHNLANRGVTRPFEGRLESWNYEALRDSEKIADEVRKRLAGLMDPQV